MAESISTEMIGTWIALGGFVVGYLKEKNTAAKELGILEQKVASVEQKLHNVDTLRAELHQTNTQLVRLESKLDTMMAMLEQQHAHSSGTSGRQVNR